MDKLSEDHKTYYALAEQARLRKLKSMHHYIKWHLDALLEPGRWLHVPHGSKVCRRECLDNGETDKSFRCPLEKFKFKVFRCIPDLVSMDGDHRGDDSDLVMILSEAVSLLESEIEYARARLQSS